MVQTSVLLISFTIILIDLRVRKIHNASLLIFALPLGSSVDTISPLALSITLLLIVSVGQLIRMGAGDTKLIILLASLQGSLLLNIRYLVGLLLVSATHILMEIISERRIPASLPFAPSILIPFLWLYLGI